MPYYMAGDYYQGGDYYKGGGLFGTLGKALKKVAGTALSLTPIGKAVQLGGSLVNTSLLGGSRQLVAPGGSSSMQIPEPGITGIAHRFFEGGHPGVGRYTKDGKFTERRAPRMDYGNIRALRRANRRARGFLRAYKSAVSYYVPKAHKGKAFVHFKKKSR